MAIGNKFGISFTGKWVWHMKDYIDKVFMRLYDPNYLFLDYKNEGCSQPTEKNDIFDDETFRLEYKIVHIRKQVSNITPLEAG